MILHELIETEAHPEYQALEIANVNRQVDFMRSMVVASINLGRPFLSQHLIKALNYHAITCLHISAGEYRPCGVTVGSYTPPDHYRVPALMDDFINTVNLNWNSADPVYLATFVLWRMNHIHPFINGNGRTARAACFFVLCVRSGGWLAGAPILPELLQRGYRDQYVEALQKADASLIAGQLDLSALHKLVSELLDEQLKNATPSEPANTPSKSD